MEAAINSQPLFSHFASSMVYSTAKTSMHMWKPTSPPLLSQKSPPPRVTGCMWLLPLVLLQLAEAHGSASASTALRSQLEQAVKEGDKATSDNLHLKVKVSQQ